MCPRFEVLRKMGALEPDEHERRSVHPGISVAGQVLVVDSGAKKRIVVDDSMVSTVTEYLRAAIPKAKTFKGDEVMILVKQDQQGTVWEFDKDGVDAVENHDYASITTYKTPKVEGFKDFIR